MVELEAKGNDSVIGAIEASVDGYEGVDLRGSECPPAGGGERFAVLERLGRGGLGEVLRAYDRDLRRAVAIKRPLPEHMSAQNVRHLVQEAQITAQLEHPSVPAVHHLGVDDEGRAFFAMTLLGGCTLEQLVAEARVHPETTHLSAGRLLRIFLQVGYAVDFAHSRGVIHRDLKPANVIVGDFGEVRLMDWGLAKLLDTPASPPSDGEPERLPVTVGPGAGTYTGQFIGTPGYMAPEQMTPDAPMDERTDVYALGALLYAILAGRPPVVGDNLLEIIDRTIEGKVTPIQELVPVPHRLSAIVHKAIATRPEDRYASAGAMLEDIEALLEGRPVRALSEGLLSRFRQFYFGRSARVARLRTVHIDFMAFGALLFGAAVAIPFAHRLEGWSWPLAIVGALLSIPCVHTMLRKPHPDDPGSVIPFTEGVSSKDNHVSGARRSEPDDHAAHRDAPSPTAPTRPARPRDD